MGGSEVVGYVHGFDFTMICFSSTLVPPPIPKQSCLKDSDDKFCLVFEFGVFQVSFSFVRIKVSGLVFA